MPARPGSVPAAADAALGPLVAGRPARARIIVATPAAAYAELEAAGRNVAGHPPATTTAAAAGGGPRLVALLAPAAVRVPGALVPAVDAAALVASLRLGDEVVVGAGAVVAAGVRLVPSRWWDSRVPPIRVPADVVGVDALPGRPSLPDAVDALARALWQVLAGCDDPVPVRQAEQAEQAEQVVAALVGLGPGLTPAGDDVVAGALVALSAAGASRRRDRLMSAVRPLLGRTTAVSAAFLEHAAAGRAVPQLARFVVALARGRDVGGVVEDLLRVGASSGAALAVGAGIGLRVAAAEIPRAGVEVA